MTPRMFWVNAINMLVTTVSGAVTPVAFSVFSLGEVEYLRLAVTPRWFPPVAFHAFTDLWKGVVLNSVLCGCPNVARLSVWR